MISHELSSAYYMHGCKLSCHSVIKIYGNTSPFLLSWTDLSAVKSFTFGFMQTYSYNVSSLHRLLWTRLRDELQEMSKPPHLR